MYLDDETNIRRTVCYGLKPPPRRISVSTTRAVCDIAASDNTDLPCLRVLAEKSDELREHIQR